MVTFSKKLQVGGYYSVPGLYPKEVGIVVMMSKQPATGIPLHCIKLCHFLLAVPDL